MSTDPSAAIGRIDAAVEESSQSSGAPPRELADLAAAIERIESLIADRRVQGPDGTATDERLSDIAVTLHEREVETSLSDTLDAAVREINDGDALKQVSPERRQQVAELLRQLSRRVHDMIAQSQANRRSEPASGANATQASKKARHLLLDEGDGEDDATHDSSFKTDVPEDDEFALVVAALTAALPSLAEFGAPVPIPPAALAQDAPPPPESRFLPDLSVEPADASPPSTEEAAGNDLVAGEPLALGDDFLRDLMPSDQPAAEPPADAVSSSDAPAEDSAPDALLALPAARAPADSTHEASAEASGDLASRGAESPPDTDEQNLAVVLNPAPSDVTRPPDRKGASLAPLPLVAPDDDPGDLFESVTPAPNIAPKPERIDVEAAEKLLEPEQVVEAALSASLELEQLAPPLPAQQSRAAVAASPQPIQRPASNDPLGPVRALSEEEMIALFS